MLPPWIPPDFAHGFQALKDTNPLYLVTREHSPQHERCVNIGGSEIVIPLTPEGQGYSSEKDRKRPSLRKTETNFIYP